SLMAPPRTKPEVAESVSGVKSAVTEPTPSRSRRVLSYSSLVSRRTGAAPGTVSLSDSAPAPGWPSGPTGRLGPLPGSVAAPPGPVLPFASSLMVPVQPAATRGAPRRHHTLRPRNIV